PATCTGAGTQTASKQKESSNGRNTRHERTLEPGRERRGSTAPACAAVGGRQRRNARDRATRRRGADGARFGYTRRVVPTLFASTWRRVWIRGAARRDVH